MAGGGGNLIDRIANGAVTDFLDLHWRSFHWPAFNLADVFIVIAAAVWIWLSFIATVLGGLGSLSGAVLGGFVVGVVEVFLQGYLPILNICLTKKFGFSGLDVNTAGAFVDATNVDAVAPLAAVEIR